MTVYLIVLFMIGEISVRDCFRRIRMVLPLVCFIGIWNPLFDRSTLLQMGTISISGGVISMITLIMKGIFSVLASCLLIATTSMDGICYGMYCMHVPDILITQFLLTYRYISLLLQEVHRMSQAYALRAPGQKGIHYKAWGAFVGQLLLRSMDRAEQVYQSMCLRGYSIRAFQVRPQKWSVRDSLYLGVWTIVLLILRLFPVMEWVGVH